MSDLIKRLRSGEHWPKTAADRIEDLERERDEALNQLDSARHSVDVLESRVAMFMAHLVKAVEALRPFADVLKGNYFHQPDTMPISMGFGEYDRRLALKLMDFRNARAVLAELEGGK
jgi:hypothetical protein